MLHWVLDVHWQVFAVHVSVPGHAAPPVHRHRPLEHDWPGAHATPHAPQLAALAEMSVSQPLVLLPSQSAVVAVHAAETHAVASVPVLPAHV